MILNLYLVIAVNKPNRNRNSAFIVEQTTVQWIAEPLRNGPVDKVPRTKRRVQPVTQI